MLITPALKAHAGARIAFGGDRSVLSGRSADHQHADMEERQCFELGPATGNAAFVQKISGNTIDAKIICSVLNNKVPFPHHPVHSTSSRERRTLWHEVRIACDLCCASNCHAGCSVRCATLVTISPELRISLL